MIQNAMETSLKEPIQTGEFRKNPVEPTWVCPAGYEYEIIETENLKVEYPRFGQVATGRVVLQLHGGGYIGPMKNIYWKSAVGYSKLSYGGDALATGYRVTPEHPYSAALEDAVFAYQWLLEEKKYRASQIMVAGGSVGGGLPLALELYLRDRHMPMPAGFTLMFPWADLTCSGESHEANYGRDPLFGSSRESVLYNPFYIGEHGATEPYISPVFGEFDGFLPMLIQVGSCEVLLPDSQMAMKKAKKVGVKHCLSIYKGTFHDFQMSLGLFPESREVWEEAKWFLQILRGIKRKPEGRVVKRIRTSSWKEWLLGRLKIGLKTVTEIGAAGVKPASKQ